MDIENQGVKKCVILTGMSGAGKSTALKVLEDQGMFAIDNIPPALLSQLLLLLEKHRAAVRNGVAAVVDVRGDTLLDDFPAAIIALKAQVPEVSIVFLDASDEVLLNRFETTRRRHPLGGEGGFLDGIAGERERLKLILELADMVLDTSALSLHEIRKKLLSKLCGSSTGGNILITSFGFKYGAPADCDFL
ncbi:MAG: RNase adapter RapZ, partial [Synergistaceae bacterium]|nr:RNase adapter RapZ [Synergistaceae bacterium]